MADGLIAIVDDDEALRHSTASLVRRAGFEVKLFESGDDFLACDDLEGISCILLDYQMPGRNGLDVLRELDARGGSPPVLIVTAHGEVPAAVEAMKLGAHDFVQKPYEASDLLEAITRAQTRGWASDLARATRSEAAALVATLSDRQREVLRGILRGLQNKVIAFELGLSTRTVESYRTALLHKLGVRGTAEAVRLAVAAGLDAAPPPSGAP
jgi:two-component system response regulator FixJ